MRGQGRPQVSLRAQAGAVLTALPAVARAEHRCVQRRRLLAVLGWGLDQRRLCQALGRCPKSGIHRRASQRLTAAEGLPGAPHLVAPGEQGAVRGAGLGTQLAPGERSAQCLTVGGLLCCGRRGDRRGGARVHRVRRLRLRRRLRRGRAAAARAERRHALCGWAQGRGRLCRTGAAACKGSLPRRCPGSRQAGHAGSGAVQR
mmetsp:Transcript_95774/g.274978  ORF Transcript_95774/g.274978 Transcript_95774/m.274978 type:complete len:202 (+) Transcript_95774:272-877(+)